MKDTSLAIKLNSAGEIELKKFMGINLTSNEKKVSLDTLKDELKKAITPIIPKVSR